MANESRKPVLIVVGVIALIAVGMWIQKSMSDADAARKGEANAKLEQQRAADSSKRVADSIERAKPVVTELMNEDAFEIKAGEYFEKKFNAPAERNCWVVGPVNGLAGGNKDVGVYVLTPDEYSYWRAKVSGVYDTLPRPGRQKDTTLETKLKQPGAHYFVVSNTFSSFSGKTVKAKVEMRCTTDTVLR